MRFITAILDTCFYECRLDLIVDPLYYSLSPKLRENESLKMRIACRMSFSRFITSRGGTPFATTITTTTSPLLLSQENQH